MFKNINSIGLYGLDGYLIGCEIDTSSGMPSFDIVGLPDAAVRESRERVRSSMKNVCGFSPQMKIMINLAPADIKKEGAVYDLPIYVGVYMAATNSRFDLNDSAFVGELSLSGEVRAVNGALPMAKCAAENGIKKLYLPSANAQEAAFIKNIEIYPVDNVNMLMQHLKGEKEISPVKSVEFEPQNYTSKLMDFSDVCGQEDAKRALEIAAAGSHNVLLIGSPGSGKSMMAKRMSSILPDMTYDEAMECSAIYSVSGQLNKSQPIVASRPFRSPHHTISSAGLAGGGSVPKPGEISLAHNGVLFLDELPEFSKEALEVLRQPLEDGNVTISRVSGSLTYPSDFMLICAMNPCKCGFYGHPTRECTCSQAQVSKYLSKISGPLLDRLDIHVEVPPVTFDQLTEKQKQGEKSSEIRKRVNKARKIQNIRYKDLPFNCNSQLTPAMSKKFCVMAESAENMLKNAFDSLGLSARAYDRILKVARTIADLDGKEKIEVEHIAEAIGYRSLDRKYWNK